MKRLLLLEDEEIIRKALKRLLERNHYEVDTAVTVEQAIEYQPATYDLVLADLRLPGGEGTQIIAHANPVPVVIMTSYASVRSAVDAMRHGAIDYIAKPFDHDELLMVIERALTENLMQAQNKALRIDVERLYAPGQAIIGTGLQSLFETITALGKTQQHIHLYGEKGTDREGLARSIHAAGTQHDAPFLIAEIDGESVEQDDSVLFGHPDTGAGEASRAGGYLQAAHNGTLVIRHVERLSMESQQRLAVFLSGDALQRPPARSRFSSRLHVITVGETSVQALLAGNLLHETLAELLLDQQFEVPPLRQRPKDILPLASRHLAHLQKRHGLIGLRLSDTASDALLAYQWPGNLTELHAVLTRAAILSNGKPITISDLGLNADKQDERDLSLDEYFRYAVLRNQKHLSETELATRLGISRKALWERRQKMNLQRESGPDANS